MNLSITREQFDNIYNGAIDPDIFETDPHTEEDYISKYLPSKLWRLNNLYTIVNKDGKRVPFRMNLAQHKVYAASLQHPRLLILKSRQQGISTFWLIYFFDDIMVMPDLNVGLMAQGKNEAGTLLKRVELAWETFPPELRQFFNVSLRRNNSEELSFTNNATLFIRVSFRSTTLQRLHISEYGKICRATPERAKETKTGTLQTIKPGNVVVLESTADGDNDFKKMWDAAVEAEAKVERLGLPCFAGKDFKPVFLSWVYDPDCVSDFEESISLNDAAYFTELEGLLGVTLTPEQKNFWIAQKRELGEYIFQEYPATPDEAFTKVNSGSYYGIQYNSLVMQRGRRKASLYDPNLPVYVMMDLGVHDTFVLLYFQRWREEWRIIDEYCNSGEGLEFYVNQMQNSGYNIETVYGPHDLEVLELGSGMSRRAKLRELGVTNVQVLARSSIADGIERVRSILPNLYIDEKCTYIHKCFLNYSREWDDKHNVWKSQPLHDQWSHGADTVRGMAMSKKKEKRIEPGPRRNINVVDGLAL